jgi:hypothetical protein
MSRRAVAGMSVAYMRRWSRRQHNSGSRSKRLFEMLLCGVAFFISISRLRDYLIFVVTSFVVCFALHRKPATSETGALSLYQH